MDPAPLAYARAHGRRFVAELGELLRFPSVSAQPRHAADVRDCAAWLAAHLERIGMPCVRLVATHGHPLVTAYWRGAAGRPTVLLYAHYDVQPTGPPEAWCSPPFLPTVVGDHLVARGASDDKGPLLAHLKALESWLATTGRLPVNVVCLFEGEEEVGSTHLLPLVDAGWLPAAAHLAVVSDTPMLGPDRPAITWMLRGSVSMEVAVRGPDRDLHSGAFGGAVLGAPEALVGMLAALHDRQGRVAVPGFYDRVRTWPRGDRARAAAGTDAAVLRGAGAVEPWGEPGYSPCERTTIRPALVVTGLGGGYQGPGTMSIVPASASARLNLRLVPDQEPAAVEALVRRFLLQAAPPAVRVGVRTVAMARPVVVDRTHPAVRAAAAAYRRAFGTGPLPVRSGGTIPIVASLAGLGLPVVLMGFGLPDDRIHAPGERLHLPTFHRAVATAICFLSEVAARLAVP